MRRTGRFGPRLGIQALLVGGAGVLALVGAIVTMQAEAQARETSQPGAPKCKATISSADVGSRPANTDYAIRVTRHGKVHVTLDTDTPNTDVVIGIQIADHSWPVYRSNVSGTSWVQDVDVDTYAQYGVGYYYVYGSDSAAGGPSCELDTYVKVTGDPLATLAGRAGAVTDAAGILAVAASAGAAAAGGGGGSGDPPNPDEDEDDADERLERARREEADRRMLDRMQQDREQEMRDEERQDALMQGNVEKICAFMALPALFLTGLAMAGALTPGQFSSPAGTRLPRARWRLRITFVGLVGGFLVGVGNMVLLQQYAILYPTRSVLIGEIGSGLLLGILLPTLFRGFAVRRFNRRIAARERARQRRVVVPPAR